MRLELEKITIDPSMQIRVETNSPTVAEYEDRMSEGEQFPPLLVWFTDGAHVLLDGWHRHAAMTNNGFVDAECKIFTGTKTEALIAAACSNRQHGLKMTSADKRKAIVKLIETSGELSSRAIAEAIGVSDHTVEAVRNLEVSKCAPATRKGKDGKKYPAKMKREKRGDDSEADRDDEPTEPPPDPGMGGNALSPETISKGEQKSISKSEAMEIIDLTITVLLGDGNDAMAAKLMQVKSYLKGAA